MIPGFTGILLVRAIEFQAAQGLRDLLNFSSVIAAVFRSGTRSNEAKFSYLDARAWYFILSIARVEEFDNQREL